MVRFFLIVIPLLLFAAVLSIPQSGAGEAAVDTIGVDSLADQETPDSPGPPADFHVPRRGSPSVAAISKDLAADTVPTEDYRDKPDSPPASDGDSAEAELEKPAVELDRAVRGVRSSRVDLRSRAAEQALPRSSVDAERAAPALEKTRRTRKQRGPAESVLVAENSGVQKNKQQERSNPVPGFARTAEASGLPEADTAPSARAIDGRDPGSESAEEPVVSNCLVAQILGPERQASIEAYQAYHSKRLLRSEQWAAFLTDFENHEAELQQLLEDNSALAEQVLFLLRVFSSRCVANIRGAQRIKILEREQQYILALLQSLSDRCSKDMKKSIEHLLALLNDSAALDAIHVELKPEPFSHAAEWALNET